MPFNPHLIALKTCPKCGVKKTLECFSNFKPKRSPTKDGKQRRCKDCAKAAFKLWASVNGESLLEKCRIRKAIWQTKNIARVNEASRIYINARRKSDPSFRVLLICRSRTHHALVGLTKSKKTSELVGGIENLRNHIERLLKPGWTWENYGKVWEVDHIKPLSRFDLSDPEQQKIAFHFSNTQPLSFSDNRSKGNKIHA